MFTKHEVDSRLFVKRNEMSGRGKSMTNYKRKTEHVKIEK